ncbi:MAG: serpin family protein [Myxococcota bacterium]
MLRLRTLVTATATLLAGCGSGSTRPAENQHATVIPVSGPVEGPTARSIAEANNRFAADLYPALSATPGNFAYSPSSISLALAMTYAGAQGETAEQMASTLRVSDIEDADIHRGYQALLSRWNDPERTSYSLRVANRLFGDQASEWHRPFVSLTGDFYGAPLEPADFRGAAEPARQHINQWVADQTEDRILDLIPSGALDSDTRLVLANAIYFKGTWATQFNEDETQDAPFYRAGGAGVSVPMMHQYGSFQFGQGDGAKILRLGYTGNELEMVFILPEERDGLAEVEEDLTAEQIEAWLGTTRDTELPIYLPRFRVDPSEPMALRPALEGLGMELPFEPTADFRSMSNERPLYIDSVFHKAFVEVNEEGTEAAAATAVVMTTEAAVIEEPPEFRADHPFLFAIRDTRSGTLMFLGRVSDPS